MDVFKIMNSKHHVQRLNGRKSYLKPKIENILYPSKECARKRWLDAALFAYVKSNDLNNACAIIDLGASPNARNEFSWTALILASANGYYDIAKLLIDKGADVNAQSIGGVTSLMVSSLWRHFKVVELLVNNGANVNAREHAFGLNVMMFAIGGLSNPIMSYLSEHGARL